MDVYAIESLPVDHPFRTLDNTVLSLHMGFVTEESHCIFYGETVENIRSWMDAKPIRMIEGNTLQSTLKRLGCRRRGAVASRHRDAQLRRKPCILSANPDIE